VREFPARFFVGFLTHHRMLARKGQPVWQVIPGGARRYVERLIEPLGPRLRLATPIRAVERRADHVLVTPRGGEAERFDEVVLAVHSDQALELLSDPSPEERAILSAIPYQANQAILHTDERLLPRSPRARACWNYHRLGGEQPAALTYDMTRLQKLDAPLPFCVTLNRSDVIDPGKVIERMTYHHPLYTPAAVAARERIDEISGRHRTHFSGAYWGFGFHEDGVASALRVSRELGGEEL
jgi:uncharacterized protein